MMRHIYILAYIFVCVVNSSVIGNFYAYADDGSRYNSVSFQVSAEREVSHNRMRITLYSEERDTDPAQLAEKTTKAINDGVVKARQVGDITIETGRRHAYPVYNKKGEEIIAWHERAELHLESDDFSALSALSAELIGTLKIAERSFSISKSQQKKVENALIEEAIDVFHERAQLATKSLGGKAYKLITLNIKRDGSYFPLMRHPADDMMAMQKKFSASARTAQHIEAGTSEIAIIAHATIEVEM